MTTSKSRGFRFDKVTIVSSNKTIYDYDNERYLRVSGATAITLPAPGSNIGRVLTIERNDITNATTINLNNGSDTVDGKTGSFNLNHLDKITLRSVEANVWIIESFTSLSSTIGYIPTGSIIPWIGGYFINGSNGSFTNVLANSVIDANTLLNPNGWYVCNGAALNDSTSPIFNTTNRYLPNLTDSRFLQGYTAAGAIADSSGTFTGNSVSSSSVVVDSHTIGTANLPTHTHTVDHTHSSSSVSGSISDSATNHTHALGFRDDGSIVGYNIQFGTSGNTYAIHSAGTIGNRTGGGADGHTAGESNAHAHSFSMSAAGQSYSGSSGNGGFANNAITHSTHSHTTTATGSLSSLVPKYLNCFYIMKVK